MNGVPEGVEVTPPTPEQEACEHDFDDPSFVVHGPHQFWEKFCKKCKVQARKYL